MLFVSCLFEVMTGRMVQRSSSSMWEVRKAAGVTDNYTYFNCGQVELLIDCVRELELQLEDLKIIRESESFSAES